MNNKEKNFEAESKIESEADNVYRIIREYALHGLYYLAITEADDTN